MTIYLSSEGIASAPQFKQVFDDAPETIVIPKHLQHHRVEVTVSLLDDQAVVQTTRKRRPPSKFAGRVKELGDVFNTLSAEDWGQTD